MIFSLFLSLLIGAFGVLQNTLNKQLGGSLGLPLALAVNSVVLLLSSGVLFFLLRAFPEGTVPELYRAKGGLTSLDWRAFVPGLLGFFIIATAPWTIEKIGATKVFIGIIVAQIIASLLWDHYMEALPVSLTKIVGALLALLGAVLAMR